MEILFLIVGLITGIAGTYLVFYFKSSSSDKIFSERIQSLSDLLNENKLEISAKEKAIIELNSHLAAKTSDFNNLKEKLEEQKAELDKIQERFSVEFKNLANEILEEKTKKFTEQNRTSLDQLLKPLGEKIKEFEKKVEETYDKEAQQRFSLKEEVKRLAELNQQVSKETNNLTKALKGDSKTQGNWGEVLLESILEKSGLTKDREYFIQSSFTTQDGKRLQPDIVVSYPGDRSIIIDSKVSLTAYEQYVAADNENEKDKALKNHLISIKNHINELSLKKYQDIYTLNSLDFVMLFMPIEPAYFLAIQNETNLWAYAYERRILLISATNLIAALKMIESMWRQEYQNNNARLIAQKSGDLYDKFVGLVEDLIDVGNRLKMTQKSYEDAMNKLSSGKGNLIKRAEDLKDLGLKTKKDLPKTIIEKAIDE
ncbi:MAG: DNA recombination protein RmuC [Bacteroidales bacterium]|nr:DNA recombination protein RmuC [Bacteroidales bacterium]